MDGFENRYAMWLKRLDEWCLKHGVSRESAMSILSGDGEGVTRESLYWAEWRDFIKASHEFSGGQDLESVLSSAADFLEDLANEWDWKRDTIEKNDLEMAELDLTIKRLRELEPSIVSARLAEAEELVSELSSGYWISILDGADDPVSQRMGQRVLAYWKR